MKTITLTVNGEKITAAVEPRTHLGDFLRGHMQLTGTHLGCEHGVCGACTVLIDGAPARSCINYAVACDGQEITTIEGFGDDILMNRLRRAFNGNHARGSSSRRATCWPAWTTPTRPASARR
jgi:carbon-monoxide dehydrogenase small subunit